MITPHLLSILARNILLLGLVDVIVTQLLAPQAGGLLLSVLGPVLVPVGARIDLSRGTTNSA